MRCLTTNRPTRAHRRCWSKQPKLPPQGTIKCPTCIALILRDRFSAVDSSSLNQAVTNKDPPNATPRPQTTSGAQIAKPASARAPRGCRGAPRPGGHAQRAWSSNWPELSERSARRARSEFEGPTWPRAPQGSHAEGVTTRVAPEPMPASQPCPALPRQTAHPTNNPNTPIKPKPPAASPHTGPAPHRCASPSSPKSAPDKSTPCSTTGSTKQRSAPPTAPAPAA